MTHTASSDLTETQLDIVRNILKRHITLMEVWMFGSRAKGTAKTFSDLDLAIITHKPLPLSLSAALAEDFANSDLPWKVDLVDWSVTSAPFRAIIEREKVVVQGQSTHLHDSK